MKNIRGKFAEITPQHLFLIFALGVLAVVPIRMYQVIALVEPETGFYAEKGIIVWVFYALLALISIVLLILSFLSGSLPESKPLKGKSLPLMITSALVIVTLVVDGLTQIINIKRVFDDPDMYIGNFKTLISSGILPLMFQIIFAFVAAIYFLIIVLSFFDQRIKYADYKLLALTPLLWVICRIIHRFMRTISYKNVSDLLLELFMLVTMMIFFLSVARVSSQIENEKMMYRIFAFGLICVIFCLVCAIPRLALTITGNPEMLVKNSPLEYCDIAVAAFILAYLFSSLRLKKETVEENPA